MTTVQAVGECMVEFARAPDGTVTLGYAGDAYNTAVYLRRVAGHLEASVHVRFLTGLGTDDTSLRMRERWLEEGVEDDSHVVPDAAPGAYLISTNDMGERSFTYWRRGSAAAVLLAGEDWIQHLDADYVFLSGITLQLMSASSRTKLLQRLDAVKLRGTRVAFDSNFRTSGWPHPAVAAEAMARVLSLSDIALVTLEDEVALGNCHDVPSCAARLGELGVREFVIKVGGDGAWVQEPGQALTHAPAHRRRAVDTTGAGDSFNGAYLAARIAGRDPLPATAIANRVAADVVTARGAILDRSQMPELAP